MVAVTLLFSGSGQSKLNVDAGRLRISTVEQGSFQLYIPLNGTVLPIRTVYLDAMEGGRVDSVARQAGTMVDEGDILLRLSNTDLLLEIMNKEVYLFEQQNNLRNTRLALEESGLELEGQLMELDFQIATEERALRKYRDLVDMDLVSKDEYEGSRQSHEYLLQRRSLTIRTQKQNNRFRKQQIEMLEESVRRIEANLFILRQSLDNLQVCAPVTGHLTSLNADVGELKTKGERLGQVDILDGFKVRAEVDEYFISRLETGLEGKFELAGNTYSLLVTKIYPEVRGGRFEIDFEFSSLVPEGIRRGQTLKIQLELGTPSVAVLIDRGGFYQDTGGRWVYVVDESGQFAEQREVTFGQQNPRVIEVLSGLEPGEKVITSSYKGFGEAGRLLLEN